MKSGKYVLFLLVALLLIIYVLAYKKYSKTNFTSLNSQPTLPQTAHMSSGITISSGETPAIPFQLPHGYGIHIFANELGKPRDLTFSPGGTLLVSIPADGLVVALPDKDRDGVTDTKKIVIGDLIHPHGLAFYQNHLFIATTTQVIRYDWNEANLTVTNEHILFSLPANNNHNNRTITFDTSGNMYVSVGSTCNVCYEQDQKSATIMISNSNGNNPHIFAKGLRNAAFMQIHPLTGQLWATEMGRDYLGDTTPPDEIDIIQENKNYGWPICYGNKIHDANFDKKIYKRNPCEDTLAPLYEIPAHAAPLGLAFIKSQQFPHDWQNDLLVAYHGSWNKTSPIGYKVVHLKVNGNIITGSEDFLKGFISDNATSGNDAKGRPVDLIFDTNGNLYLSDDKAGTIYIIQKST